MLKTIKIEEKTHSKLTSCGKKGETFDTIIDRLVNHYKEYKEKGE